ncbi:outer membrane protein [Devosia pacifica]|uniref:Outer membrane protein n=1 Tax=Devosia pacifica TaxID=1335967 RepID=A0A918RX68_9HYPH|nr:DsbA family protein [Devosia pacifica]GHA12102.1 outer membrane protein [Devosia pacifica]
MSRIAYALVALAGAAVGGGAAYYYAESQPTETDAVAVRSIVDEAITEYDATRPAPEPVAAPIETAQIDPETLNPMIEDYLMADPSILQRMSAELETRMRTEQQATARAALATYEDQIYNAEGDVVLGNPDGDVTLVELFDYNCGYCRQALPDLATLLAEDPELKVILKEFPILSQESVEAARVAILVNEQDVDYWQFHEALFTSRGQVNKQVALDAAQELGLSPVSLELDMNAERVAEVIQNSYEVAQGLNITGTPTYIIGDEIVPGAIGVDALREKIANVRACGSTICEG